MKHIVLYIIIGITLLGCSERQEYVDRLEQAQNLLDEHPDSALQILDSLSLHEQDFSKSFRMKYQLLHGYVMRFQKVNTIILILKTTTYLTYLQIGLRRKL